MAEGIEEHTTGCGGEGRREEGGEREGEGGEGDGEGGGGGVVQCQLCKMNISLEDVNSHSRVCHKVIFMFMY